MVFNRKYKSYKKVARKPPPKKKANQSLTALVKRVSLNQAETLRSTKSLENIQLYHNQTYYITNLLHTTQGDTNPGGAQVFGTRQGQEVIAKGLSLKFWLSNKNDRPNCMYKIIVFKYPTRGTLIVGDALLWQGTDGQGAQMNRMIDSIATNRVHILAQRIIHPDREAEFVGVGGFGKEKSHLREIYIPLKDKKLRYIDPNSFFPQDHDIGFAVVAYDSFGTLTSDNIASYAYVSRFTYKDP